MEPSTGLGIRFPPHGRGWTIHQAGAGRAPSVSPARAGMDRSPTQRSQRRSRFPRTGGDGPLYAEWWFHRGEFPPHGRGWTRGSEAVIEPVLVSPARAGMDLALVGGFLLALSFPRTGGDGPTDS